jgi:predicted transcriptional regulator
MKKKRDRLEVVYDFLKIIKDNGNSMKPTPLLRFSNLSSQRFSEYLRELEEKGFVKVLPGKKNKKIITLQDKGFEFLEKYMTIRGFIDEFGL